MWNVTFWKGQTTWIKSKNIQKVFILTECLGQKFIHFLNGSVRVNLRSLPEEAVCVPFPVLDRSAVHGLTLTREEVCWKQIGRATPSCWDVVFAASAVRNAKEAICCWVGIAAAETLSGKWRWELQMWPKLQQPDLCSGLWCSSGGACDRSHSERKKFLKNYSHSFKKDEKRREKQQKGSILVSFLLFFSFTPKPSLKIKPFPPSLFLFISI